MDLQFVSYKELINNYIRQDFYRTKFILYLTNLNQLQGCWIPTALENLLGLDKNSLLDKNDSLVTIEATSLDQLKGWSSEIIAYNGYDKTVNNMQIEFLSFALGVEIGSHQYLDINVREEFLLSGKSPFFFEIQRTATKIPVLGVGGGSMSNLLCCRYVLTSKKHLKRALFIKHNGDISNSKDQALVPILENDLVIEVGGSKPFDLGNESLKIKVYRVVAIHQTKIECEDISEKLDKSYIPKKVVEGSHIYHNRDGSYFCSEIKTKKEA